MSGLTQIFLSTCFHPARKIPPAPAHRSTYQKQYLLTQAVSEYGIEVSDEEIDEAWDNEVAQYGSEETLLSIMQMYGYTEDTYRQQLESSVALEKLRDEVAPLEDPSDQEIIDYVNENLDSLNDARRSSHILIKVDSEADDATREEARQKLEDLRAQIEAGEISFADAAKENSEDSSAKDGGDVGWDKLTSFVTEYGEYHYTVTGTRVATDTDTTAYDLDATEENLIMYTCYPFDALGYTPLRYFVYAKYVSGPVIE